MIFKTIVFKELLLDLILELRPVYNYIAVEPLASLTFRILSISLAANQAVEQFVVFHLSSILLFFQVPSYLRGLHLRFLDLTLLTKSCMLQSVLIESFLMRSGNLTLLTKLL